MFSFRSGALAALLLLACAGAQAGKGLPRYGVAVYSDLCVDGESGEMGGQRISLHRFAEADIVMYEFTAGSLSWPLVANQVSLDSKTGIFSFSIQGADYEERVINGRLSRDGLSLTLDGGYCSDASIPMKLSKVSDFSRKPATCKPCPAPKPAQDS